MFVHTKAHCWKVNVLQLHIIYFSEFVGEITYSVGPTQFIVRANTILTFSLGKGNLTVLHGLLPRTWWRLNLPPGNLKCIYRNILHTVHTHTRSHTWSHTWLTQTKKPGPRVSISARRALLCWLLCPPLSGLCHTNEFLFRNLLLRGLIDIQRNGLGVHCVGDHDVTII